MSLSDSSNDLETPQMINSPIITEMNISDIIENIESGKRLSYGGGVDLVPFEKERNTIDFSKVDISKIPMNLIKENEGYIRLISERKLPDGIKDILEDEDTKNVEKAESVSFKLDGPLAIQTVDSVEVSDEVTLCAKMKDVFRVLNFRADGKIIVDPVSFIAGLRQMGLDTIEEKEVSAVFADFDEDNATEVDIEKIIIDIKKERTVNILKLKNQLKEALNINHSASEIERQLTRLRNLARQKSDKIKELEDEKRRIKLQSQQTLHDLEFKNTLFERQISTLRENLATLDTQYKSDLMYKTDEIESLHEKLRESEVARGRLEEQLKQSRSREHNLNSEKSIKHSYETKAHTSQVNEKLREKLEKITARASKYKAKHEKLKEELYETKMRADTERSQATSVIQTLRFQLDLMQMKPETHARPPSSVRTSASARTPSRETMKSKIQRPSKRASTGKIAAPISLRKPKVFLRARSHPSSRELFSKKQKITVGVVGNKICTTEWRFVTNDFSKHTLRLSHEQSSNEVDAQATCRRVIYIDGQEHYNKNSSSKNYIFNISSNEIRVSIVWENFSWKYKLAINGESFQNARVNV